MKYEGNNVLRLNPTNNTVMNKIKKIFVPITIFSGSPQIFKVLQRNILLTYASLYILK